MLAPTRNGDSQPHCYQYARRASHEIQGSGYGRETHRGDWWGACGSVSQSASFANSYGGPLILRGWGPSASTACASLWCPALCTANVSCRPANFWRQVHAYKRDLRPGAPPDARNGLRFGTKTVQHEQMQGSG